MLIWVFLGRPLAVIAIVVGALLLARFLRRRVKWRWYWPVVLTVVFGWLVLPTASILFLPEGKTEDGQIIGGGLTSTFEYQGAHAAARAAEICGDAEGFDIDDPTLRYVSMPLPAKIKRHFYFSGYSNIVWVGVGWKDRYCLARYQVTIQPSAYPVFFPVQIFPYPVFPWREERGREKHKFLDRVPTVRPLLTEGVKVLFPGECWAGRIGAGETLSFQVEMPDVGQENHLHLFYECERRLPYRWTRNGRPLNDIVDKEGGRAAYRIELVGPSPRSQGYSIPYQVGVFWGHTPGCWRKASEEPCPERTMENL